MSSNDLHKPEDPKTASAQICPIGRQLLEAFGVTVQVLVKLHEQQFLSIVQGEPDANRFDLLIHEANEQKQNAKYAYMAHCEGHGCSLNQ